MTAATLVVDPDRCVGPVDRRLFGAFVEHVGRAVHSGIHEPGHPLADGDGLRTDVVELVRGLGVSGIRYPGGNFVSGFRWEDSVGPRDQRPRRLDLAWHSTETNEVGLHEFADWLDLVGGELVLAVNLGTRGTQEALDLLEYANVPGGSALSDLRAQHGRPEPFAVRTWCLGNEMDGPWQLGHRCADDYGKLAARTAGAMRQLDPRVELVVCGSSSAAMPTFGEWERVVLGHTAHLVDHVSCHAYYCLGDDLGSFLASAVDMDRFIETVAAIADDVCAERGLDRRISISFDEWNVWDVDRYVAEDKRTAIDDWPVAPRILEEVYTVADAVVLGSLLISLLKHADRVRSACLAQLVNVLAPIMTEPGGPAWTQTTYVPFATTSRLARGRVLAVDVRSGTYPTAAYGQVPLVDAVATHDPSTGAVALFVVNRATDGPTDLEVDLGRTGVSAVTETVAVWDDDLTAANTLAEPERVRARTNGTARLDGGRLRVELPPVSWTALALA